MAGAHGKAGEKSRAKASQPALISTLYYTLLYIIFVWTLDFSMP